MCFFVLTNKTTFVPGTHETSPREDVWANEGRAPDFLRVNVLRRCVFDSLLPFPRKPQQCLQLEGVNGRYLKKKK